MRRQPAAASVRTRGLLLLLVPLLAHCGVAAQRRPAQPVPPPIALAAGLAPAAGIELVADPSLQRLLDPYPSEQGPSWLGGDVASSIRLADDRWAWIFGDTLLGSVSTDCPAGQSYCARSASGPGAGMIANSAGVMVRSADGVLSPLVKYWRADAAGAPAPIFAAPGDDTFLWPLAGVRVGAVLLVAANQHTRASGLLPVGNVLVRVWNPDAPPDAWLYDVHPLRAFRHGQQGGALLSWTSALVLVGDRVYLFGSRDVGVEARTVLARLDTRGVADRDWSPRLEFLLDGDATSAPVWEGTLDPDRLHVVEGLPGTSEASIDFAPGLGWYTFQIPALRHEIRLYTASDLLGPWSDRGVAYEIPAAWRATQGDCPADAAPAAWGEGDPGCAPVYAAYAPKAHPELAPAGGAAVSYNVNTWSGGLDASVRALETLHGFYVPQLLSSAP